jgi:hypothetical protein
MNTATIDCAIRSSRHRHRVVHVDWPAECIAAAEAHVTKCEGYLGCRSIMGVYWEAWGHDWQISLYLVCNPARPDAT